MKNFIYILLAASLFFIQAARAEVKVAVIDVQGAILASDYAKEKIAELKKQFAPEQQEIKELAQEIQKLQAKGEQDAAVMSESERKALAKQIEDKAVDYQFLVQKLQKTQNESQQELLAEMNPRLQAAIKEIIDEGTYNVILERRSAIYISQDLDITKKVTEKLNSVR